MRGGIIKVLIVIIKNMEGLNVPAEKNETIGEKLTRAAERVVGYFREKFAGVLDRIKEKPYFVSPSERSL